MSPDSADDMVVDVPNFLVRLRENHEAVGFFAVEDLEELAFWVDEVCDPSACEAAQIGSGSIIWEGKARKVPDPDHDWDNEKRSMLSAIGKHDLGGLWAMALFREDLEFTPLDGLLMVMPRPANEA